MFHFHSLEIKRLLNVSTTIALIYYSLIINKMWKGFEKRCLRGWKSVRPTSQNLNQKVLVSALLHPARNVQISVPSTVIYKIISYRRVGSCPDALARDSNTNTCWLDFIWRPVVWNIWWHHLSSRVSSVTSVNVEWWMNIGEILILPDFSPRDRSVMLIASLQRSRLVMAGRLETWSRDVLCRSWNDLQTESSVFILTRFVKDIVT